MFRELRILCPTCDWIKEPGLSRFDGCIYYLVSEPIQSTVCLECREHSVGAQVLPNVSEHILLIYPSQLSLNLRYMTNDPESKWIPVCFYTLLLIWSHGTVWPTGWIRYNLKDGVYDGWPPMMTAYLECKERSVGAQTLEDVLESLLVYPVAGQVEMLQCSVNPQHMVQLLAALRAQTIKAKIHVSQTVVFL